MMVKLKQIQDFLEHGDKVLVSLNFRGREIAHADMTKSLMDKIVAGVESIARVERKPVIEGRRMFMMLVPKNAPVFHHSESYDVPEDDNDWLDSDNQHEATPDPKKGIIPPADIPPTPPPHS